MTPGSSARLLALLIALTPLTGCAEEEGPKLVFYDTSGGVEKILIQNARAARESGWAPRPDGRLVLEPIPEELARSFFGGIDVPGSRKVYDADCYYFAEPDLRGHQALQEHHAGGFPVVTNNLGLREDADTEVAKAGLRILVTGDSHTDGMCANSESFPNRLEALLAERRPGQGVEVLNAGRGGFGFHNYLGVYQKFRHLDPDVFIIGVYLGNDFAGDLKLLAWNQRIPLPGHTPAMGAFQGAAVEENPFAYGQAFLQLAWFDQRPGAIELSLDGSSQVLREIALRCEEDGVEFALLFIPPATDTEWYYHQVKFERVAKICLLDEEALQITDRMTDSLKRSLSGIPIVDGREHLPEAEGPFFWLTDKHLNVKGHQRLAEALLPVVEELLSE